MGQKAWRGGVVKYEDLARVHEFWLIRDAQIEKEEKKG